MRLPIFHEITVSRTDTEYIRELLKRSPLGLTPCFVVLDQFLQNELMDFINVLKSVLKEKEIDPSFPYPIYIVTSFANTVNSHGINLIENVLELPSMFKRKSQRPRAKQAAQLAKIELLAERLRSLDTEQRVEEANRELMLQDDLFNTCLEHDFYKNLHRKIRSREGHSNG